MIFRDQYTEEQLPAHPCLELLANSEQILSNYTSRRLLTYKKIKEPKVCIYKFNFINNSYFSILFSILTGN